MFNFHITPLGSSTMPSVAIYLRQVADTANTLHIELLTFHPNFAASYDWTPFSHTHTF